MSKTGYGNAPGYSYKIFFIHKFNPFSSINLTQFAEFFVCFRGKKLMRVTNKYMFKKQKYILCN